MLKTFDIVADLDTEDDTVTLQVTYRGKTIFPKLGKMDSFAVRKMLEGYADKVEKPTPQGDPLASIFNQYF